MNSPTAGWAYPNSLQEELFYGSDDTSTEDLSYEELQAIEEERSLTLAGY